MLVGDNKGIKCHQQYCPTFLGEQYDMITSEQSVDCGKWPLMYFPKQVEGIFQSSGSWPWQQTETTGGGLKNTDAWVSVPEILI